LIAGSKPPFAFDEFRLERFNPPAADEGLIPRPLGRLKFSD